MENLNDLIWTDEDSNENGESGTMGTEMYKVCLVAFCDSIVRGGSTGSNGPSESASNNFSCGGSKYSHSGPC